jgi:hypothetical protein
MAPKCVDDATKSFVRFRGHRRDVRVVDQREHRSGVRDRNDDIPVGCFLHHDVAWKQESDARLGSKRPMRKARVASAEDRVPREVDIEFLLERGLYVDLGEDAEALALECVGNPLDRWIEVVPASRFTNP